MLPLIALAGALHAEDLTTTEGRIYKGVTITKVEPDGISIMHESGTAKVPFTKLSKEVQLKHGHDAVKIAEERKIQEVEAQKLAAKEWAARSWAGRYGFHADDFKYGVSLEYWDRATAAAKLRQAYELEFKREKEIRALLAHLPTGGILYVSIQGEELGDASGENQKVIIRSKSGSVLARFDDFDKVPKHSDFRGWSNVLEVVLREELKEGDQVRVVNTRDGTKADFTVSRMP